MPAVWAEFQQRLALCPTNRLERQTAEGIQRVYRWVRDLSYQDDEGRWWRFNALEWVETPPRGNPTRFAWITSLFVNAKTGEDIAQKGGRYRWKIENEGFNRQQNSGLNLEHVYSTDPEKWKAYYYLLQIAFILIQLLERGSLLRRRAAAAGRTVLQWFGSLKNIARRLLESIRYDIWPEASYDAQAAARLPIGLDSSSRREGNASSGDQRSRRLGRHGQPAPQRVSSGVRDGGTFWVGPPTGPKCRKTRSSQLGIPKSPCFRRRRLGQ